MDTYRTEEEQVAAIKRIVADHGSKILGVILISIAVILGVQGYLKNVQADKEAASLYYNQLVEAVGSGVMLTIEQQQVFDTNFDKLLQEYPDAVYVAYATFIKAKMEADKGDLDAAAASLNWVVSNKFDQEIIELARLRLARVTFAQGDVDQALSLLDKGSDVLAAEYAESKADVLVAQGDKDQALTFYLKAQEYAENNNKTVNHILKMKVESLQPEESSELYPLSEEK